MKNPYWIKFIKKDSFVLIGEKNFDSKIQIYLLDGTKVYEI